jgi:hypothetical protein
MKKLIAPVLLILLAGHVFAQVDPALLRRTVKDSSGVLLNMDAVFNRPFLQVGKLPLAIGGYAEANYQYLSTDGISEGHQFQMRRFTLFVSAAIAKRIKFLSEVEFEDGAKEINIEFAALDIEFDPLLNLRGGIIMNPIGSFNQNHDGPKWEFIDRPISATQMLPATFSNAGFGVYGKKSSNDWAYAYEVYLTNGFDDKIIANDQNKTFLPAAKQNPERFEESFNGQPLFTGKVAVKNRKVGELGLSYMGGIYNKFEDDGIVLDKKRGVRVVALDFNTKLSRTGTAINAEWAWVHVDVPETYTQQFGDRQQGGFIDVVQPVMKKKMLGWENATLNAALRLEYVDWNKGRFRENNINIADDIFAIVPAISFRPSPQTVIRLNYRYHWQTDILGNPAARTAGWQFGFSTYF